MAHNGQMRSLDRYGKVINLHFDNRIYLVLSAVPVAKQ
jgi:hypothetical protein